MCGTKWRLIVRTAFTEVRKYKSEYISDHSSIPKVNMRAACSVVIECSNVRGPSQRRISSFRFKLTSKLILTLQNMSKDLATTLYHQGMRYIIHFTISFRNKLQEH